MALATTWATLSLPVTPAAAHGPCGSCVSRAAAAPGERLWAGPAYRVIWNPAPRDFRGQTTPVELASAYRPGAPTEAFEQGTPREPVRRLRFRISERTPPGVYMALIFDGSEGGSHTTWAFVQVPGAAPPGAEQQPTEGSGPQSDADPAGRLSVAALIAGGAGIALVALLLGAALGRQFGRSR